MIAGDRSNSVQSGACRTAKFVAIFAASVFLGIGCSTYAVRFEGSSMRPTINNGDRLLIEGDPGEIRRGDIVVHIYPKDQTKKYIKRIIGLPGETIEFRGGRVMISGEYLEEPYIDPELSRNVYDRAPEKIGLDEYYVLGDNRDNSSDSRSWGTVPRAMIVGRVKSQY